MSRSPVPARRPGGRAVRRSRLAQLPGPAEAACFLDQLRSTNRRSAARALVDAVFVVATLKTRGARPLFARRDPTVVADDPERARQVATAVDAAFGLIPVAPSCLRRSVTLLRELHRLRLAATMHIGVRKVDDAIEAHAWVQAGEVVVNDDPEVTKGYVELASGELERLLPLLR